MSDEVITRDGIVKEELPKELYRVLLEDDSTVVAKKSSDIVKKRVSVIVGDSVQVVISPYDLTKGRIIHRY